MNLQRLLALTVERVPDLPAVTEGERSRTYAEWWTDCLAVGEGLRRLGLRRGDRVVLVMGNSLDHATATTGATIAGFVAVPINPRSGPGTVAQIISDAGAAAAIHDDPGLPALLGRSGVRMDPIRWIFAGEGEVTAGGLRLAGIAADGAGAAPGPAPAEQDLACLLYTSGTTGYPKGLPNTHQHVYARIMAWLMHFGPPLTVGVRALGSSPLYHITGLHCVLWVALAQNGMYSIPVEHSPEGMLAEIEQRRLSYTCSVPIVLDRLVRAWGPGRDVSSMALVVMGSAPRPDHLLAALHETFPNAVLAEAYGNTEGVMLGSVDMATRPGAFQATGDLRARVIRPGGHPDEISATDQDGELIVSIDSERVVEGYWRRPDADAERFRDGWLYTGDGFRRDAEGHLHIGGRLDEMFISGGENVQPAEIEAVLLTHPGIRDVAVLGLPDPQWGEVCSAFVVREDPGVSAEDIDAHCRANPTLANFMRPRKLFFVEEIPRNPTGKILRRELRGRYVAGQVPVGEERG